jgi:NADH-quinone oxidoreductase subunit J
VSPQEIAFILIGLGTATSAIFTVTSRNLVHAALFLAATLAGIGAVFLTLHADFVAWVQVVVYVGAIAVLFLFGLMLTRAPIGRAALDSQNRGLGIGVAASMFVVLTVMIVDAFGGTPATAEITGPSAADIGLAIFSTWVFPFELASMLLLGALVGAILLSRRASGESGSEDEAPTHIAIGAPPSTELDAEPSRELVETTGGDQ